MTKPKLQAYAVAALFSDGQEHFLSIGPYVAASRDLATASVVSYVMSDSRTTLPLQMVNTIPLSVEWLRGALQLIEASEAVEEKPKVLHLVPAPHQIKAATGGTSETIVPPAPPPVEFNPLHEAERCAAMEADQQHSLACPKRWGGWGHCRCGAA
jgi:hypothetical protein